MPFVTIEQTASNPQPNDATDRNFDAVANIINGNVDSSNLANDAVTSAKIADGAIVNADVNAAAAIAYSKLNLASSITSGDIVDGTIVNADVNASAAIELTKLAAPAWTTWVTTYGGFSADPTQALRYSKIGRNVTILADVNNATGTSNATTFTMTLPFAAAREVRYGGIWGIDNTGTTVLARADTGVGSSTLSLFSTVGGAAWTASGTKGVSFCITYEATS